MLVGKLDDDQIADAIAQARAEKRTLRLDDGQGLRLIVAPTSSRWILRFVSKATGKRRDMGLGSYPRVTLQTAREITETQRAQILLGDDPLDLRRKRIDEARKVQAEEDARRTRADATLKTVARQYHARIAGQFRNDKHREQWLRSLEVHVFPELGDRAVGSIEAEELLDLLIPLRDDIPETARRIRQRLDAIFEHAMLKRLADRNPAQAIVRAMREGRSRREERHFAALDYAAVPGFLANLRAFDRIGVATRLALEWTILTGARTGETLGATWQEIDLDRREWRVPAARMKAGRMHRAPLTARALEILEEARPLSGEDGYLFPSPLDADRPLSNMSMLMALRRLGFGDEGTVHGFRQCLSAWARENTRYRIDTIEAALAHRDEDKVARAYSHAAEYWDERRALAEDWEKFCTTPPTAKRGGPNVVQLPKARAAAR